MTDKTPYADLPVLRDIDNKTNNVQLDDNLQLSVIEGPASTPPEYFRSYQYAMNLHVRGKITATINHQRYTIEAPCFSSVLINQVLSVHETSDDMIQYVVGFSPQFADELNLHLPGESHIRAYMRPVFPMTEQQMKVAIHYFDLLREVMQAPDVSNAREVALDLIRSFVYYVYGLYDKSFSKLYTVSRAEELAGQFLALVEVHSHEHHSIDWYANEMCLSPKYVANVVKEVIGRTAGKCINENLIRQAKSLLRTTALSVQEISERLGFRNQSHFGTFFRRETGVSPKAFRVGIDHHLK